MHSRPPWIRTKCLTPPARNRGEPWPECAARTRWPSRAVLATMKAMTSSEVDVGRNLQPDLVRLHQRVGSQVSDCVGTLPEIGTPHPVPRSGCTAKLPEAGGGAGFPKCSEPVAFAGSIGVGGFGTALRIGTLGERWLSTGAMVAPQRRHGGHYAMSWTDMGEVRSRHRQRHAGSWRHVMQLGCVRHERTGRQAEDDQAACGQDGSALGSHARLSTLIDSRLTDSRIGACYHRLRWRQTAEVVRMSHPPSRTSGCVDASSCWWDPTGSSCPCRYS